MIRDGGLNRIFTLFTSHYQNNGCVWLKIHLNWSCQTTLLWQLRGVCFRAALHYVALHLKKVDKQPFKDWFWSPVAKIWHSLIVSIIRAEEHTEHYLLDIAALRLTKEKSHLSVMQFTQASCFLPITQPETNCSHWLVTSMGTCRQHIHLQ